MEGGCGEERSAELIGKEIGTELKRAKIRGLKFAHSAKPPARLSIPQLGWGINYDESLVVKPEQMNGCGLVAELASASFPTYTVAGVFEQNALIEKVVADAVGTRPITSAARFLTLIDQSLNLFVEHRTFDLTEDI